MSTVRLDLCLGLRFEHLDPHIHIKEDQGIVALCVIYYGGEHLPLSVVATLNIDGMLLLFCDIIILK